MEYNEPTILVERALDEDSYLSNIWQCFAQQAVADHPESPNPAVRQLAGDLCEHFQNEGMQNASSELINALRGHLEEVDWDAIAGKKMDEYLEWRKGMGDDLYEG